MSEQAQVGDTVRITFTAEGEVRMTSTGRLHACGIFFDDTVIKTIDILSPVEPVVVLESSGTGWRASTHVLAHTQLWHLVATSKGSPMSEQAQVGDRVRLTITVEGEVGITSTGRLHACGVFLDDAVLKTVEILSRTEPVVVLPNEPGTWWLSNGGSLWKVDSVGKLFHPTYTRPEIFAPFRQLVLKTKLDQVWRAGSDSGFEYGYLKGSTDPDFMDASDAPANPYTKITP